MSRKPHPTSRHRADKAVEFGLRLLTAVLITSAAGLVLLQLSLRFGNEADKFDTLTFSPAGLEKGLLW